MTFKFLSEMLLQTSVVSIGFSESMYSKEISLPNFLTKESFALSSDSSPMHKIMVSIIDDF